MKKIYFYFIIGILYSNINVAITISYDNKMVYFYNWSEYVSVEILNQFTQETGIKVMYSTYESNESMYIKLKTYTKDSYDLVVPSTYFVAKMSREGMLQKIDKSKLTQFKNLDPNFLHKSFDPKNDYSIPHVWGATGIGINSDVNNDLKSIASWADLWKPEYKNRVLLTDDSREVFQIALLKLGYSGNTTDPNLIAIAYEELKKLMPNVIAFNSDNPAYPFIQKDVNCGMLWNGSAYIIRKLGVPIKFVWPKEGAIFWMDSFVIPSNAKNVDGAIQLINFLLRPDIAARISQQNGYPTPNLAAKKLLPVNIATDTSLYPSEVILKHGEWQNDVGNVNILYENYFQQLKTNS
ncbi:extracellular solute-binding protein [Arsenophonus endosymbiont of Lipoptena cervi]|uniref:extracellular solute-binding protein n=1 Tax=Arsenophonus TaxID=637 RepID=UPI00376F340C